MGYIMTQRKQDYSAPNWGKSFAAQIKQVELVIKGIGNVLLSIQEVIFSVKKLWLSLGGLPFLLDIVETVDWQTLSALIK
jgi:hypothetical protein